VTPKKPLADPEFAARMAALAAENHEKFLNRPPGDGVIGVDAVQRNLGPNDYPPVVRLVSNFKPTKRP
jgi:hypothetical protein